jgi:hypothetical protein
VQSGATPIQSAQKQRVFMRPNSLDKLSQTLFNQVGLLLFEQNIFSALDDKRRMRLTAELNEPSGDIPRRHVSKRQLAPA